MKKGELEKLKKDELIKLGKKEGVKLSESMKKDEMIELIVKASKSDDAKSTKTDKKDVDKKAKSVKKDEDTKSESGQLKKKAKSELKKPNLDEANDTIRGESKKFEIEDRRGYMEPSYELVGESTYELPENYGQTRLTLLVQDPYWLHAYWEINDETRRKFGIQKDTTHQEFVIRVYNAQTNETFDVRVNAGNRNWYFNIPQSNQPYFTEIGLIDKGGNFVAMVRSNTVFAPSDKAAAMEGAVSGGGQWSADNESSEEIFKKSGGYMIHKLVGSQVVSEWIADTSVRSSASGSISSGSGGMGAAPMVPQKKRGFWAELHTELIVYGATEPDAKVTVGGVPTKLTPDGKFSIRFYLKDGDHPVPFVATSNDEIDTIEITPFVSKHTERKEWKNK